MKPEDVGEHPAQSGTPAGGPDRDTREAVAPSKPVAPRPRLQPAEPEPIDVEIDDEVAPPTPPPPASEILPEARSPFEDLEESTATPEAPRTPLESMGHAIAANAALHAAGAHTPLGGVPLASAAQDGAGLDFDQDEPAFVPTFAGAAARDADVAGQADGEPEPDAAVPTDAPTDAPALAPRRLAGGDTPLYRPRVAPSAFPPVTEARPAGGTDAGARDAAGAATDASSDGEDGPAGPRDRTWPKVLLGLLALAVIGVVAWWLLRPDPIELPPQQVLATPSVDPVEPIAPQNPTPFLAAMPLTSGDFALVATVTNDPLAEEALPGRVAESHTLTYSDGTSEVTLEAKQLYNDEDARQLMRVAAGDSEISDAMVGDTKVGRGAETTTGDTTTRVWTNGSAYFAASGPTDAVHEFVTTLGL